MRILVGLLIGFVFGAVAAGAVLFYNPVSQHTGKAPAGDSYFYDSELEHFAMSHAGKLPVPMKPSLVQGLWESAVNGAVLTVFPLMNSDGEMVALASRISALSEDSDLLLRGAKTNNDWLLSFPGRGTLFIDDRENLSDLVRHGVVPVWLLRQAWGGSRELLATTGPDAGSAQILGGTGEFANASGRMRQRHLVEQFGSGGINWRTELGLVLDVAADPDEQVDDGQR
jgi:hypothetical protein